MPTKTSIDENSKRALEILWHEDAVQSMAMVPTFAKMSWHLSQLFAPPEMLKAVSTATIQEVDLGQKCLAMSEQFSTSDSGPGPLPSFSKLELAHDRPLIVTVAMDSLIEGCLIEGFNADVAEACVSMCIDAPSKKLLENIFTDKRFHERLCWQILKYCFHKEERLVKEALLRAMKAIYDRERPPTISHAHRPFYEKANPQTLADFGRLPESEFQPIWGDRIRYTELRLIETLKERPASSGRDLH